GPAAAAGGPGSAGGPRRAGGARPGRRVPATGRVPGHWHAGHGRVRGGAPPPAAARPGEADVGGPDRLGPDGGPPALPRGRLPAPPGQARGAGRLARVARSARRGTVAALKMTHPRPVVPGPPVRRSHAGFPATGYPLAFHRPTVLPSGSANQAKVPW